MTVPARQYDRSILTSSVQRNEACKKPMCEKRINKELGKISESYIGDDARRHFPLRNGTVRAGALEWHQKCL